VPPLASVFIALLKNTSIASAFFVAEALQRTQGLINANGQAVLWILAGTAVGYLCSRCGQPAVRALERALAVAR
jgi:glutamate transport system permease protein